MPAAPPSKPTRNSLYGWNKKRSVSPAGPSQPSKVKAVMPVVRKGEENLYFEEEYADEIVSYMHYMESNTIASADLMDMQPELQWYMRPYLIDFLIEIHQQFRLRPEVLYLAINIVDRYVSKRVVYKKHYQLVGCAALWIAAKFEDGKDRVPLVKELAEMCCKAYDESAFIQMEGHVLSTIQWCIGHPTAEAWLRMATTGAQYEEPKVQHLARFLMEITLFHRDFVGIQSSLIAAGALMLARFIMGRARKPLARYEHVALRIAQAIDKQFSPENIDTVSEIAIRKYAPIYYSRASTIAREWYLSGRRFVYQEAPATPVSIPTPGLAPSWTKRGSWVSSSPSGSISCSSSDAGDDAPLTPITPVHAYVVDPFSLSAKENIAPNGRPSMDKVCPTASQRPALITISGSGSTGDLSIPQRSMRRLSN